MAKDGTLREIARWALLVIIVVGAALVWWKTPTEVQPENLSLDLQDGKVTVVEVGCLSERLGDGTGLLGFPLATVPNFSFRNRSRCVGPTSRAGRMWPISLLSWASGMGQPWEVMDGRFRIGSSSVLSPRR